MTTGKIIAANEEKGPQAEILGPGFHFKPLIRILYDIDFYPVIEIPAREALQTMHIEVPRRQE